MYVCMYMRICTHNFHNPEVGARIRRHAQLAGSGVFDGWTLSSPGEQQGCFVGGESHYALDPVSPLIRSPRDPKAFVAWSSASDLSGCVEFSAAVGFEA